MFSQTPNSNPNPNLKAQKPFRENELTSFLGKCPDTVKYTAFLWCATCFAMMTR